MPTVLIATGSNWTSIARLPRVLKHAGYRVEALCAPDWAIAHTRYLDARHEIADRGVAECARELRYHLERTHYDWVIVGDDPLIAHLCGLDDASCSRAGFLSRPIAPPET